MSATNSHSTARIALTAKGEQMLKDASPPAPLDDESPDSIAQRWKDEPLTSFAPERIFGIMARAYLALRSETRSRENALLVSVATRIRDAFNYDPGHSDLDGEQPIHITVTLRDWRELNYALNSIPLPEAPTPNSADEVLLDACREWQKHADHKDGLDNVESALYGAIVLALRSRERHGE